MPESRGGVELSVPETHVRLRLIYSVAMTLSPKGPGLGTIETQLSTES